MPDEDLLQLSALVDLPNTPDHPADQALWKKATPIAEKLLKGPCDCEQRNWLNHFVEMGNAAQTGSEDQYKEDAKLMATLGRNDSQAIALGRKGN